MHSLLDHLAAAVITSALILMLAAVRLHGQRIGEDVVHYRTANANLRWVAQMVDVDVRNLGSGLVDADTAILAFDPTGSFEFYTREPGTGAGTVRVRYTWQAEDSTYALRRYVEGRLVGRSDAALVSFDIMLEDAAGRPLESGFNAVERVSVAIEARSTLEGPRSANRSSWSSLVYPPNLRRSGSIP